MLSKQSITFIIGLVTNYSLRVNIMKPRQIKKTNTNNIFQGDSFYHEGWAANKIYYLKEGSVDITMSRGGKSVVLATIAAGEIFGEMEVMLGRSRFTSATAKTYCEVCIIEENEIEKQIAKASPLIRQVLKTQAKHNTHAVKWAFASSKSMEPVVSLAEVIQLHAGVCQADPMTNEITLNAPSICVSYNRISGLSSYEINSLIRLLEELNFIRLGDRDQLHIVGRADTLVERVIKLTKSHNVNIKQDLQGESDFMDLSKLGDFVGADQDLVLKQILAADLSGELLTFRKSEVVRILKEKGKDFFTRPAHKNINELEDIDDISYVDKSTLAHVFGRMNPIQIAELYAGTREDTQKVILDSLSDRRQSVILDTANSIDCPDALEVEIIGLEVIEQIRGIRLAA